MALSLLNPPAKSAPKPPLPPPPRPSLQFAPPQRSPPPHLSLLLREPPRQLLRPLRSSSSSSAPADAAPSPPSSREEAVSQARSCLATALRKALNNLIPLRKLKKQRQPRFRAEIPVVDDSPGSLARLASDVFSPLVVSTKGGAPAKLLLVWPSADELGVALRECENWEGAATVAHAQLDSVAPDALSSCDAAVFLAPSLPQVEKMRDAADALGPKPVVLFNPAWSFDEEEGDGLTAGARGFVGSFNVVFSFMGLEVRGLLSKKKGVLLRCVDGGQFSGESWVLMVKDDDAAEGEFKVVSKLKRRPTIGEVETMLYNLMAANSPVTKSARFLRELVSNVTGAKGKKQ